MSSSVTQDSFGVDGDVCDSNSPSDPGDSHVDLATDLVGISRTTKDLNIVNRYRPKWVSQEATWCVFPQTFTCLGVDRNDDSTEDDHSLYRDPSKGPPPSVPVARLSPSALLRSKPQPARSKSIQTDLSTQSKKDSYVIGTKIEHTSLDWGGGFPGSHDFYRTRDQLD
ncbi:unnamed protein product [Alternaria alternata]|nr:hypothetical protein AA0116_g9977 [Alternaria tenuissima]